MLKQLQGLYKNFHVFCIEVVHLLISRGSLKKGEKMKEDSRMDEKQGKLYEAYHPAIS